MDQINPDFDLHSITKDLKVDFERSFTIQEFIKEIKGKMKIFTGKREEKTNASNLNTLNSYKKEIQLNLKDILYEYKIKLKNKEWT